MSSREQSVTRYRKGLGFDEIEHFENHEEFDGVMLGKPGLNYILNLLTAGLILFFQYRPGRSDRFLSVGSGFY